MARLALLLLAAVLMVTDLALIFLWVPTEQVMGVVQRIMYFHVPLAWVGFLAFFVVFCASALYLWKGWRKMDALGHSAAEIGVLFTTLMLVTGATWAKPIWGVWWTWDPRLTTALILWFLYVAYLMLRAYAPTPAQAARYSAAMGIIGFVEAGLEIKSQIAALGVSKIHAWGLTGRSLPGLRLLAKNLGLDWKASMIKYSPADTDQLRETMVRRSKQGAELMKLPIYLDPDDVEIIDGFHGGAYAAPTDAAFEAIHLVAQTEAVILDPNYTGKSMSALIARIRSGGFSEDDTVLFLHSGGLPQVFAFNEELAAWSPSSND
ncbi:MAG: pyridoxal-phosphate dependent enzyme [Chloroflexi bacterium]|nr:pyridoxal-phosphate dependent enzyme [Chloroflexota bacterium]